MRGVGCGSVGDLATIRIAADEHEGDWQRRRSGWPADQLLRAVLLVEELLDDGRRRAQIERAVHLEPSRDADLGAAARPGCGRDADALRRAAEGPQRRLAGRRREG